MSPGTEMCKPDRPRTVPLLHFHQLSSLFQQIANDSLVQYFVGSLHDNDMRRGITPFANLRDSGQPSIDNLLTCLEDDRAKGCPTCPSDLVPRSAGQLSDM